ncbi:hypothetical protein U0070_000326 [Myodes glareolus]|uniref:Uncharacterized protein n=1 Tax=Myodes glareolus TaxID=447135 RepID=A0AAW0H6F7_MYOGA
MGTGAFTGLDLCRSPAWGFLSDYENTVPSPIVISQQLMGADAETPSETLGGAQGTLQKRSRPWDLHLTSPRGMQTQVHGFQAHRLVADHALHKSGQQV